MRPALPQQSGGVTDDTDPRPRRCRFCVSQRRSLGLRKIRRVADRVGRHPFTRLCEQAQAPGHKHHRHDVVPHRRQPRPAYTLRPCRGHGPRYRGQAHRCPMAPQGLVPGNTRLFRLCQSSGVQGAHAAQGLRRHGRRARRPARGRAHGQRLRGDSPGRLLLRLLQSGVCRLP